MSVGQVYCTFISYISIYSINNLSVSLSGQATKGKNVKIRTTIFSVPNWHKSLIFPVHIPLICEHLFYKYFVSWSVGQAKKGRNVKISKHKFLSCYLKKDFFLVRLIWSMIIYSVNISSICLLVKLKKKRKMSRKVSWFSVFWCLYIQTF